MGGNNEQKNIDLVRSICSILDEILPKSDGGKYQDLIEFVTDRPGHEMRYAIDASKIKNELGWEPAEDNQSGMKKTVQWYLDNEPWWGAILSGDYKLNRIGLEK